MGDEDRTEKIRMEGEMKGRQRSLKGIIVLKFFLLSYSSAISHHIYDISFIIFISHFALLLQTPVLLKTWWSSFSSYKLLFWDCCGLKVQVYYILFAYGELQKTFFFFQLIFLITFRLEMSSLRALFLCYYAINCNFQHFCGN